MINSKIYILLITILLSTACRKSKDMPDNTPAALQLQVGIGSIKGRTTAIPGTTFTRESKINVVLTDYDGNTTNYNNRSGVYTYKDQGAGGVWLPEIIAAPLQLNANEAMVLAHYPAQLPVGASYNVTTKVFTPAVNTTLAFGDLLAGDYNADNSFWFSFKSGDPQTEIFMAEGEIDYMYGKMTNMQPVSSASKLAQIQMNHGLTMVIFNLFKSDLNQATSVVKSIKVKNINSATALQEGTFSIPDGGFTPSGAVEYARTMDNFPDNSYFGMMLFPATIAANQVVVEFKVDNQTYTLPIEAGQWKAGTVNLYRIRFTPARAELVDVVQVVDWGAGTDKEFEIN